ncbi:uncharacterized protein MYCFIDRAFT_215198 [Pseudocercospora fijiensis CIRAD86]|uniref:Uncharacterized protein n=1 Tax=Pseudocercospora fijiensis (strain CIRAD86) TaxID=383855 RepID=M3B158_PSEFD|nr:uncharacterized protein MYCFIDRAFT_215198 [Pseudocercospora fijiensis CIRAD86]EME83123.1 hypothetical protein MYCFIDRAFT_215198 [Pseudocercospora fijiensis CIRAD86]
MAPKKAQQATTATRRSTRIASRAGSSRASSVAPEEEKSGWFPISPAHLPRHDCSVAHPREIANHGIQKRYARQKVKKELPFSSLLAIERIVGGDRAYIQTLTQSQKEAVITAFAGRELDFQRQVRDLQRENQQIRLENEELSKRAASAPNKLRDTFLAERIAQFQREELKKDASQTPKPSKVASRISTPAAAKIELSEQTDFEFSQTSVIEGTPAVVQTQQTETPFPSTTPQNETPSRRSFFGSLFRSFTTPFSSRKTAALAPSPAPQTEQSELGELPASRKRPAPAPEPSPEPLQQSRQRQSEPEPQIPRIAISETPERAQAPRATSNTPTQHRTVVERSLATITEYTEPSEQAITRPEPTPSRQPRRIRDTRMRASAHSATPSRAWTPQPAPREPNADRRLEKLRKYQELDQQLRAMKADPETKEIVERPMKRVKIDDLVSIPHNRPGDAKSTFRMFEIDSDEEMEVDEDVETRSNVFETSESNETPKVPEAPVKRAEITPAVEIPQPAAPKIHNVYDFKWTVGRSETTVEMVRPQKENEVFQWPTLQPRTKPPLEGREAYFAAATFAYGMAFFEKHGAVPAGLF